MELEIAKMKYDMTYVLRGVFLCEKNSFSNQIFWDWNFTMDINKI
jgi:hypothetical protein